MIDEAEVVEVVVLSMSMSLSESERAAKGGGRQAKESNTTHTADRAGGKGMTNTAANKLGVSGLMRCS